MSGEKWQHYAITWGPDGAAFHMNGVTLTGSISMPPLSALADLFHVGCDAAAFQLVGQGIAGHEAELGFGRDLVYGAAEHGGHVGEGSLQEIEPGRAPRVGLAGSKHGLYDFLACHGLADALGEPVAVPPAVAAVADLGRMIDVAEIVFDPQPDRLRTGGPPR